VDVRIHPAVRVLLLAYDPPMSESDRLSWYERLTGRVQPKADLADSYDLQIDQQALSLIQLKQQLTYFLITGSTGAIAFVVAFVGGQAGGWMTATAGPPIAALSTAAVAGLAVAGLCLLQLYLGHRSFTLHLRYRTERIAYAQLPEAKRKAWDQITRWANRCLSWAFVLLFVEILATLIFFWLFVHQLPQPLPQCEEGATCITSR